MVVVVVILATGDFHESKRNGEPSQISQYKEQRIIEQSQTGVLVLVATQLAAINNWSSDSAKTLGRAPRYSPVDSYQG